MNKSVAVLKTDSPFYVLFPEGKAPIFHLDESVSLENDPETGAYMLDVNRCTQEQLTGVSELVAKLRGGTPAEVMDFLLAERRLPIRKIQVDHTECNGISLRMIV